MEYRYPEVSGFTGFEGADTDPDQYNLVPGSWIPAPQNTYEWNDPQGWPAWPDETDDPFVIDAQSAAPADPETIDLILTTLGVATTI